LSALPRRGFVNNTAIVYALLLIAVLVTFLRSVIFSPRLEKL